MHSIYQNQVSIRNLIDLNCYQPFAWCNTIAGTHFASIKHKGSFVLHTQLLGILRRTISLTTTHLSISPRNTT